MSGALDGIRVIDLAQGIAGPYGAMLLAEQGADVLKIEPPEGDPYRTQPGFCALNRSKEGAVADIETEQGRNAILEAVAAADVLVYDGSPGDVARLGLDYASLSAINRRLVYCWMPPYGSRGPHAERAPDDALVAALDGIMATQYSIHPGPTYLTVPLSSYGAAILAAGAICAALWVRQRTGQGQLVEVSWLAGGFAVQTGTILMGEGITRLSGVPVNPLGPVPVYRVFRAADDRYLFLACGHSGFFHRFCLLIDRPDIISDSRFENAPWGIVDPDDRAALARELEPIMASKPRDEWLTLLSAADIPCAPVLLRDDYLQDPQVEHIGMRALVEDPELGSTVQPGTPLRLHGTPGGIRGGAPLLGGRLLDGTPFGAGDSAAIRGEMSPNVPLPASALAGLRVLDLSAYIAGSLCPMTLADWGADVIKIEGLDGDPFRAFGFGFLGWNRGKRSVAVDLKRPEGRELIYELVHSADVVVENFRPGVSERLGVDYETLQAINPRLIYSSETAYGRSGPYVTRPGFDPLLQARSGMMAAQGGLLDGHSPVFLTVALCDYGAALLSVFGISAALVARERTGEGQRVETNLTSSAMAMQMAEFVRYQGSPPPLEGGADYRGPTALCRAYEAQDGWMQLAIRDAAHWVPLTQALDRFDLLHTYTPLEAIEETGHGYLATTIATAFLTRTVVEWLDRCDRAGVPAGPVISAQALFSDPHIAANDLIVTHQHPVWGRVEQTGQLVKFGRTPGKIGPVASMLGQHTEEVLIEAGIGRERVRTLLLGGIISQHSGNDV